MKINFLLLIAFTSLTILSCNPSKQQHLIEIKQKMGIGERLYLSVNDNQGNMKLIDSFTVVDNQKPTFLLLPNDSSRLYSITSSFNTYKVDFIRDVPDIKIEVDFFARTNHIYHSPATKSIMEFNQRQAQLTSQLTTYQEKLNTISKKRIDRTRAQINQNYISYADSVKNITAFLMTYNQIEFGDDYSKISDFINRAKRRFSKYPEFIKLNQKVTNYIRIMTEELNVGDSFPDFSLPGVSGNCGVVDPKIPFTFVDFWATWNPQSLKYLVPKRRAFSELDSRKIQMVSIAIDPDQEVWRNYLNREHISWKNLIDVEMWEGIAINKLKFDSIPVNFLVNKQGKIVAKNIKVDSLFKVLSYYTK